MSTKKSRTNFTWIAIGIACLIVIVFIVFRPRAKAPQAPVPPSKTETSPPLISSASGTVTLGAFNIQVFGTTKRSKPGVMNILCPLARKFDVLLVEEIRDSSDETAAASLDCINKIGGPKYGYLESPRLGRTSSKEAYAYFYNTKTVSYLSGTAAVFADTHDWFEREPYLATFRSGNFDFTLVGIHVKPDDAAAEIDHLDDVVVSTLGRHPGEKDLIVMGDFNGDGTYFDENSPNSRLRGGDYLWAIGNAVDTMVTSDNTYDRIVLRKKETTEYLAGSAGVLYFDKEYGLNATSTRAISDHYPVYARFSTDGKDDD